MEKENLSVALDRLLNSALFDSDKESTKLIQKTIKSLKAKNAELATLRAQNAALVEALGGLLGGVNGGVGEFAFFASPEKIREAEAVLKTARGE